MAYVLMQTDFGGISGAMIGVCKMVDRDLHIYQISNTVPKFDIKKAAENLVEVIPFWPEGTVFVSVVDPGVGTDRKASVARLDNGSYVVSPDNGIFDLIDRELKIEEIREIDQNVNRYKGNEWSNKSDIFHGRDVFSYCGARLASGVITYEEVGPAYDLNEMIRY
ncbi:MAG: SAM-dependent chlorinase/fluorinase [Erysipelotrichaceae bacterium]|nr:SAM-dependent chlorinase/fluorinase [Erysipelotrichaceae bacterium]